MKKTLKTSPALSLQASIPNTPATMDTITGTLVPTLLVIYITHHHLILKSIKNKDGGRALTSIYTRLKVSSMFPHVIFAITKSGRIGSDKALSIASSTASCNKNTHNYTKGSSFIIAHMSKSKLYMKLGFLSLRIDEGFWRKQKPFWGERGCDCRRCSTIG